MRKGGDVGLGGRIETDRRPGTQHPEQVADNAWDVLGHERHGVRALAGALDRRRGRRKSGGRSHRDDDAGTRDDNSDGREAARRDPGQPQHLRVEARHGRHDRRHREAAAPAYGSRPQRPVNRKEGADDGDRAERRERSDRLPPVVVVAGDRGTDRLDRPARCRDITK